jgi:hypothetical protein
MAARIAVHNLLLLLLLSLALIADSRVLERIEIANCVKASEAIKTTDVPHPRPMREVSNLDESMRLSPTGPDPQHHWDLRNTSIGFSIYFLFFIFFCLFFFWFKYMFRIFCERACVEALECLETSQKLCWPYVVLSFLRPKGMTW